MKIKAPGGLNSEGDHSHVGHLNVGKIKVYYEESLSSAVSQAKEAITGGLSNIISDKIDNITSGIIHADSAESLKALVQDTISSKISAAIEQHVDDNIVDNITHVQDRLLEVLEGEIKASVNDLLESNSELIQDLSAAKSFFNDVVDGHLQSEVSSLVSDLGNSFGKSVNDMVSQGVSGALGSVLKSQVGSKAVSVLGGLSGAKIVVGSALNSSIIGKTGILVGAGSKLTSMIPGGISIGGGSSMLSLSSSGISIGGGSSPSIDIGGGSISIGGESIIKSPKITVNLTGSVTGSGNTTLTELADGTININTAANLVNSFNSRVGDITLTYADVTAAIGGNLVLNSNTSLYSNNATYLNGQNSAFYTNATNLSTGTLDTARLPSTINIASQVYIGNSTVFTTSNSTLYTGTANNATNLNGQNAAFYSNASNLSTGTVPSSRLSGTYTINIFGRADDSIWFGGNDPTYYTNATNIASGTLDTARLPSTINVATQVYIGNSSIFTTSNSTVYTGTANNATNLGGQNAAYYTNATNIASGTLDTARLPSTINVATQVYVGNSTVFTTSNSTVYTGTANNATNLGGQNAAYYTNATNIASGTVPTARLGSGTANSTTALFGDNTWKVISTAVANSSTSGTVIILNSVSNTATDTYAAAPNSVKTAYDAAITANTNAANASFLTTGTVPTARLGSGTANSTTVLFGNNTWGVVASTAGAITSTATGNVTSTNVQSAIAEIDVTIGAQADFLFCLSAS